MFGLLNLESRAVGALFIGLAEIISHDSFLDVLESTQILKNIAAGVIKKYITFVVAADGYQPL
jgi:hypothetical protein